MSEFQLIVNRVLAEVLKLGKCGQPLLPFDQCCPFCPSFKTSAKTLFTSEFQSFNHDLNRIENSKTVSSITCEREFSLLCSNLDLSLEPSISGGSYN
ncbi:hypothetical protein MTR67_030006 [Solanum verrucosum]|uniref:Uncharacterized protein n=1 Tax=Solanum verrucosum TaxID=315347 RepID=A0AAF0TXS3_SOLVR|nr:hypothetical protein MTR67_030006 [Solanum verrucosum]